MADVAQYKEKLGGKFAFLADKIATPRARRISVDVPAESLRAVLEFAIDSMGFGYLCAITGLDEGDTLAVIYHLAHTDGTVLNLRTRVRRDAPVLKSITDRFPGAANYERELIDLLGFQIEGVPPGNRYPLPEDWPAGEHPLRKDWKREGPAAST